MKFISNEMPTLKRQNHVKQQTQKKLSLHCNISIKNRRIVVTDLIEIVALNSITIMRNVIFSSSLFRILFIFTVTKA